MAPLAPIPAPGPQVTGHHPADPRNRHQLLETWRQFGLVLPEPPDLFRGLHDLLLLKLQGVQQLVELEAQRPRTGPRSHLLLHSAQPLAASRSRGELAPFEEQQRLDP